MSESANRDDTKALEQKAAAIRQDVDVLLREADRRRQRLIGLANFRTHPAAVAGAVLVLGLAGVGIGLLVARRYQEKRSVSGRLHAYGEALRRMVKHPESVGKTEPNLPLKVLTAAASTLASTFAKRGASRLVPR